MRFLADELKTLIDAGVVSVGKHSYGNARVSYFQDATKLTIGNFTSIADAHFILGGGTILSLFLHIHSFAIHSFNL